MQSTLHVTDEIPIYVLEELENLQKSELDCHESVISASSSFEDVLKYLTSESPPVQVAADVDDANYDNYDVNGSSNPQESNQHELSVPAVLQQIQDDIPAMADETAAKTTKASSLSVDAEKIAVSFLPIDSGETAGQSQQMASGESVTGSDTDSKLMEHVDHGVGSQLTDLQPTNLVRPKNEKTDSPGKENRSDQSVLPPRRRNVRRTFKCNHCNKTFQYKHHMAQHSVVHSGVKPYKCEKCPNAFSNKGSLIRHSRSKAHKL